LVKEVEITPPKPKPGDPIAIIVRDDRQQRVPIELNYEQTVPVRGDAFEMQMDKINVPWPKNRLTIEAMNIATLNVAAKFLLWINKRVDVVNGSGKYTLTDVPKGTYTVKLNGTTPRGTPNVTIKITAYSELPLDGTGCGVYTLQTTHENTGNIAVKCQDVEKHVEIKHHTD
jgi:hypothetical protein